MNTLYSEYTIEPECFRNMKNINTIFSKFGYKKGKLFRRLPHEKRKWGCKILQSVKQSVKEKKMTQREQHKIKTYLTDKILKANDNLYTTDTKTDYDINKTWIDNAISDDKNNPAGPVQAIIISDNEIAYPKTMSIDDVYHEDFDNVVTQGVESSAENMANTIELLLKNCKKRLYFIDPHFKPVTRYENTLKAFLEKSKLGYDVDNIQYHVRWMNQGGDQDTQFERTKINVKEKISSIKPTSVNITFYYWDDSLSREKMHDRFVITELGGVSIGSGLDESPGYTKNITNHSVDFCDEKRKYYDEGIYKLIGEFKI